MYFYNNFSNVDTHLSDAGLENTNTILWHTFHQKYWTYNELINTPQWKTADRIFLVGQEGNIDHMINLDSRIHAWDSLVKPGTDRFYSYFWWWWQTIEVNRHQQLINRLTDPLLSKPTYVFDCIMGRDSLHRNYINHLITTDQDTKKCCLVAYKDKWLSGVAVDSEQNLTKFKMSPGNSNLAGTLLPFNGLQTANIATWVPWKIYNQSWFSIVAETSYQRNFFTEKTAKAILAKKMFVYIGAVGALQDLRHLGFKTFDCVIDESYDTESDDHKRWDMAFEQIRLVCSQKPEDVYQKVLPILEHNQQLMLERNWYDQANSEMRKIVHGS